MEQLERIELEEFVSETMRQVETAAGGRTFASALEFEVLVTQTKKMDGGVKIYIASGQASTSTERVQTIKFKIYPKKIASKNSEKELTVSPY